MNSHLLRLLDADPGPEPCIDKHHGVEMVESSRLMSVLVVGCCYCWRVVLYFPHVYMMSDVDTSFTLLLEEKQIHTVVIPLYRLIRGVFVIFNQCDRLAYDRA